MNMVIYIGRHCSVSSPDYLLGAAKNALETGSNTLTFFLGSPARYLERTSEQLNSEKFISFFKENNWLLDKVAAHAPYLINLANLDNEKIFNFSVHILKREIKLMEEIGINLLIFHPGSSLKKEISLGLERLVNGIDKVLEDNGSSVSLLLETMCSPERIGGSFEHLAWIINKVKKPEKIGVCWDTCHLFSAGYDLVNNLDQVIKDFDEKVGLDKLLAIHINDSLNELGEKKDRHANIGKGKIGLEAIRKIVHHPLFKNIPKFLETPFISIEKAKEEIRILKEK